jgi:ubiquinone/menaquinone biosynthesis C-methylase UbiE
MSTNEGTVPYTLGTGAGEQERLRAQADDLRPHSDDLFGRIGVKPGWSALDLGCGPSGSLGLLAELTGPDGRVLGLDANPDNARLAGEFAAALGLANVRTDVTDARSTGLPGSSFDLVYARLLLTNIPRPEQVVSEMVRLARPGGWVAGEEPDPVFVCYPPNEAWTRLVEVLQQTWRLEQADINMGRRLPGLYRAAGLEDVGFHVFADAHPAGHRRRMIVADLARSLRPKILDREVVTERELDGLDRAARSHIADPGTVMLPVLYFTAWGRKPS